MSKLPHQGGLYVFHKTKRLHHKHILIVNLTTVNKLVAYSKFVNLSLKQDHVLYVFYLQPDVVLMKSVIALECDTLLAKPATSLQLHSVLTKSSISFQTDRLLTKPIILL